MTAEQMKIYRMSNANINPTAEPSHVYKMTNAKGNPTVEPSNIYRNKRNESSDPAGVGRPNLHYLSINMQTLWVWEMNFKN